MGMSTSAAIRPPKGPVPTPPPTLKFPDRAAECQGFGGTYTEGRDGKMYCNGGRPEETDRTYPELYSGCVASGGSTLSITVFDYTCS